jgi:hypothetical protein
MILAAPMLPGSGRKSLRSRARIEEQQMSNDKPGTPIPGTGQVRDPAGQIINSSSLPPSGTSTTIMGSGGTSIPATMVGPVAVANKSGKSGS